MPTYKYSMSGDLATNWFADMPTHERQVVNFGAWVVKSKRKNRFTGNLKNESLD